MTSNELDTVS